MHGLIDEDELEEKPHQALISSMHYLHHAICACSHSPELGGGQYKLARGGVEFVMLGEYTVSNWPDLGDWSQILETIPFAWKAHPEYELVPELHFRNPGLTDLRVGVGKLTRPLSVATMNDIGRVRFEHD